MLSQHRRGILLRRFRPQYTGHEPGIPGTRTDPSSLIQQINCSVRLSPIFPAIPCATSFPFSRQPRNQICDAGVNMNAALRRQELGTLRHQASVQYLNKMHLKNSNEENADDPINKNGKRNCGGYPMAFRLRREGHERPRCRSRNWYSGRSSYFSSRRKASPGFPRIFRGSIIIAVRGIAGHHGRNRPLVWNA